MKKFALLFSAILVACQNQTPPPINPPIDPPPPITDLIQLETTPVAKDFVVTRGQTKILVVKSKLLSPAAKQVALTISGSSGVEISPKEAILVGNTDISIEVRVPADATNNKPFFRVNGQAQNASGNNVRSNQPSILFQWTVPAAP